MSQRRDMYEFTEDGLPTEERRAPVGNVFAPFSERIAEIDAWSAMSERTRANLVRALESIDSNERDAFLDRHGAKLGDLDTFGPAKYADFPYWAYRNVMIAERLGLDRSPPLDILDIGMGSGSFAMVAQSMGHRVLGTDVESGWYDELCRLAGVRRLVAPIVRGGSYAPVEQRFDLITVMLPVFHRTIVDGKRIYWSVDDWRALLGGIARDLLKDGGRLFILMPLDKDDEGKLSYSPLLDWAAEHGARLDRTFSTGPIRHILFDPARPETFA